MIESDDVLFILFWPQCFNLFISFSDYNPSKVESMNNSGYFSYRFFSYSIRALGFALS